MSLRASSAGGKTQGKDASEEKRGCNLRELRRYIHFHRLDFIKLPTSLPLPLTAKPKRTKMCCILFLKLFKHADGCLTFEAFCPRLDVDSLKPLEYCFTWLVIRVNATKNKLLDSNKQLQPKEREKKMKFNTQINKKVPNHQPNSCFRLPCFCVLRQSRQVMSRKLLRFQAAVTWINPVGNYFFRLFQHHMTAL